MGEKAVIKKLGRIDLFRTLKDDVERMNKLASIVTWQECKTGDEVISEGVEGSELFILYKGTVSVHKRTLEREPYTIVTLRDHEDVLFGELALMDRDVRSASVTAETDCEFLVIKRDDFTRLGKTPDLAFW